MNEAKVRKLLNEMLIELSEMKVTRIREMNNDHMDGAQIGMAQTFFFVDIRIKKIIHDLIQ